MPKTIYAITAATGNFGQTAVATLRKHVADDQIIIIARNLKKAKTMYPTLEVRHGDYADKASMTQALAGVNKVLFISSGDLNDRTTQHQNVVAALKEKHVDYVAYTSYPHIKTATAPLAADHKATEQMLEQSGIAHSFLRNNWYLENEMGKIKAAKATHTLTFWGKGKTAWVPEANLATAAALVLVSGAPKSIYEFGGVPISYPQLAELLSIVANEKISAKQVSRNDAIAAMVTSGLSQELASIYASFDMPNDSGDLAHDDDDLTKVLGHAPSDILATLKALWQQA